MSDDTKPSETPSVSPAAPRRSEAPDAPATSGTTGKPAATRPAEIGGPAGPEPTRYGDWEQNGRCTDF
ncbi:MAG: DUF1674 domain-containing protein [Aliidongia sp.]